MELMFSLQLCKVKRQTAKDKNLYLNKDVISSGVHWKSYNLPQLKI